MTLRTDAETFRRIVRATAPFADSDAEDTALHAIEISVPTPGDRLTVTATDNTRAIRYTEFTASAGKPWTVRVNAADLLSWVRGWPTISKKARSEYTATIDPESRMFTLDGPTGRVATAFPEVEAKSVPDVMFRATLGGEPAGRLSAFVVHSSTMAKIASAFEALVPGPAILAVDVGVVTQSSAPTIIVWAPGRQLPANTDLRVVIAAQKPPRKRG